MDWTHLQRSPFSVESAQSRFHPIVNMCCANWKMKEQKSGGLLHPGGGLVGLLLDPWPCVCKQIHHMCTHPLYSSPSLFPHVSPFQRGDPTTYTRLPLLNNLLFCPHYCVRHSFLGQWIYFFQSPPGPFNTVAPQRFKEWKKTREILISPKENLRKKAIL